MRIQLSLFLLLGILPLAIQAQDMVTVRGQVLDAENDAPLITMMVVSKRTGSGTFGNSDAEFILPLQRDDALLVGAIGYETISYSIPDDHVGGTITETFRLRKLVIELPEVEILSERDLEQIQKDIESLGYRKSDYMVSGVDAFQSPVTFLYQAFSRRERSKRLVAELSNDDRRRALLKELLVKYVDYDIIQLKDDRFDEFIDFANVSDHFMRTSTQYDFLVHIKKRYEEYRNSPQWLRDRGSDSEYYRKQ